MPRDGEAAAAPAERLVRSSSGAANDNAALPSPVELSRALDRGEVSVFYDPVIDLASGLLAGLGVSARWFHPDHGTVAGRSLARLARTAAVDARLPLAILDRAARRVGRWPGYGFLLLDVEASLLERPAFADALQAVLRDAALKPTRLMLAPIHEAVDPANAAPGSLALCSPPGEASASLQHCGPRSAMLRLDRCFATDKPGALADLQRRAVMLGRDAGLAVLARGLDSVQHVRMARIAGCTLGQGRCLGQASPLPGALRALPDQPTLPANATANSLH